MRRNATYRFARIPMRTIFVSRSALCTHTGFGSEPKGCHSKAGSSFTEHLAVFPRGRKVVAFCRV